MPKLIVSPVEENDLPHLAEIYFLSRSLRGENPQASLPPAEEIRAMEQKLRQEFRNENSLMLKVTDPRPEKDGPALLGFIAGVQKGEDLYGGYFHTMPSDKKPGSQLLQNFQEAAMENGVKRLIAMPWEGKSKELCRRLGFQTEDNVTFVKRLDLKK